MQRRSIIKIACIGLLLLMCFFSFFGFRYLWEVPPELIGKWQGMEIVTMRYHPRTFDFEFVSSPDTLDFVISIQSDGNVSGKLGHAVFQNCTINKNRGNLERLLNWKTDFIIRGKLVNSVFEADTFAVKEISMPFNLTDSNLQGTLFHLQKAGVFPIANVYLHKVQ